MCGYCAGSYGLDGFVDDHLRVQWKSLLPVCQECRDVGALPLARTRKRNASAIEIQAETVRLAEEVRDEREEQVDLTEEETASHPILVPQRQARRRKHRSPSSTPRDMPFDVALTPIIIFSPPVPSFGVLSESTKRPE
jgi:hypothetical protein